MRIAVGWHHVAVFVFVASIGSSFAQDGRPIRGFVYHTSEWSQLQYDCSSTSAPDFIECQFAQASVRKKAGSKNPEDEIKSTLEQLKKEKPKPEECSQHFDQFIAELKSPNPKNEAIAKMPRQQLLELTNLMNVGAEFCRNPNEATVRKMVMANFDMEARTCIVGALQFSVRLKRLPGTTTWASNEGPEGPCGVVTIIKMEAPDPKYKTFYNYTQRKIVTLPNAKALGDLMSCSQIDQVEQKYEWTSKPIFAKCDYLEFGF